MIGSSPAPRRRLLKGAGPINLCERGITHPPPLRRPSLSSPAMNRAALHVEAREPGTGCAAHAGYFSGVGCEHGETHCGLGSMFHGHVDRRVTLRRAQSWRTKPSAY